MPLRVVLDIADPSVGAFISNTSIDAKFAQSFAPTLLTSRDGARHCVEVSAVKTILAGEAVGSVIVLKHIAVASKIAPVPTSELVFPPGVAGSISFPLIVLDESFTVIAANLAFYSLFQVSATETEGLSLSALGTGQWAKIDVLGLLDRLIKGEIVSGEVMWKTTSRLSDNASCC